MVNVNLTVRSPGDLSFHTCRTHLSLQSFKPVALPSYDPLFHSNYNLDRKYNKASDENDKLRRQYKKEYKGTVREFRKDAMFISQVKNKKTREKDVAYKAKMKQIYGRLGNEYGEK